ncbi:MAG: multiple sugar transport system substrate-binding protein [Gaiellales bacterium]|jgi:multiple sugar transport system substrate-binding protein|nr:multiple sugar transport system substrate-binding protein [Gaiellales bacterium]MDX6592958.1 multiple sugar transport system substrate-binding protein [Gaiellales bacterium]
MKRVAIALSIALVALAAGCGGGSSSDEPNTAGPAASTDKTPVTITLRHPWTGDEKKLFEESLAGFQTKYPWITVKAVGYPDSDTFDQQIVIKTINAGNPPDAFLSFGPDYVGQYCANDLWQDLTPFMQGDNLSIDSFAPAAVTYTNFDDKQCALPSLTDAYGLYYNKDLFAKAGLTEPPKTMTELMDYAKKLTQKNADGSIKVAGFVPMQDWGQLGIADLARSWGASYFDDSGNPQIGSGPGWPEAFTWQKDLIDWYGYDNILKFYGAYNNDEFSAQNAFQTGKVAMMFDGEWRTAFIKREAPDLNYATAFMPVADDQPDLYGSARVGGTIVGVPKGSPHPEQAWLLVKYLSADPAYLVAMANAVGNVPTTEESATAATFENTPQFQTFIDVWNNPKSSFSPPLTPTGAGYNDLLEDFVGEWQAGKVDDLQAGLEDVDKKIADSLALGNAP